MDRSIIHELLRASDIKRWHLVRTARAQNLAEHSFNVAVIAMELANRWNSKGGLRPVNTELAMARAITHDLDEIFTGDMPPTTKKEMRKRGFDMKELGRLFPPCSPREEEIVKAADFIEALTFLDSSGDGPHATRVRDYLGAEFDSFLADRVTLRTVSLSVIGDIKSGVYSITSPMWEK